MLTLPAGSSLIRVFFLYPLTGRVSSLTAVGMGRRQADRPTRRVGDRLGGPYSTSHTLLQGALDEAPCHMWNSRNTRVADMYLPLRIPNESPLSICGIQLNTRVPTAHIPMLGIAYVYIDLISLSSVQCNCPFGAI